ncbi:MAG TPA: class III extradiol dioxygenase family protein [Ottowia sp.]|uniref:class III extradiol dioxygenase family protein n=1 Tax=Ottowia sp. TaxID=1898956 RepID=UPI002C1A71A3|nr:class III extradiol dioxygenase family protein [Ottowia sp.]HMN22330.1 class III extradiol dioxygenase family protein [Ottowia sp.]
MARIIGSISTSHVPAIGGALARNKQQDPYWKPFFDGYGKAQEWLARERPDVVVIIHNDHGLNFFLDKMPTFAVGAAETYRNADEGWGIPALPAARGSVDLSWHIIESLIGDEFDLTTCQEALIDHAVSLPLALLWPDGLRSGEWPVEIVPVCINTVLAPYPSAARCYRMGQALRKAIESWDADKKVLIIGSGGLSHQLDGERAGHINKDFDLKFMDSMVSDPKWVTRYSNEELVDFTGTQGIELLMWVAARGAIDDMPVRKVHSNYHIPISNTATGLLVLEPA